MLLRTTIKVLQFLNIKNMSNESQGSDGAGTLREHRFSFFLKWANPGLFFVYFQSFKQTIIFLHQINVNKCPSSIRRQDSNPQPFKHES